MSILFYLLSLLPNYATNLGFGNILIRFYSIPTFIFSRFLYKTDLIFLFSAFLHFSYSILSIQARPFNFIDLGYVVAYVYIFCGVVVVKNNIRYWRFFFLFLFVVNISYAAYQNIILNLTGDMSLALFHQNTHSGDYVIPKTIFSPYLYRVTGLFVESAPFVIYLMITHLGFKLLRFHSFFVVLNIVLIFLCGSKVGYVFLILLFGNYIFKFLKVNFLLLFILFLLLFFVAGDFIGVMLFDYVNSNSGVSSLYTRYNGFMSIFNDMLSSGLTKILFGYGFVTTDQISSGDYVGHIRSIDFFSIYIYSNGFLGSVILLLPICFWLTKNIALLNVYDKNLFYIILFLSLFTMGSLLNFQYAFLMFILASNKQMSVNKNRAVILK